MDEDLGRYESAAGWKPEHPYRKQLGKINKAQEDELGPSDSMLDLLTANEWINYRSRKKPPVELYGPIWREGELAVLIGDHGTGKSILAVQLAEEIAGARTLLSASTEPFKLPTAKRRPPTGRRVLYIDFQRTAAQWAERYSASSTIPDTQSMPYQFAENFDRAGIDWTNVDFNAYNRDPVKFALHSVFNEIQSSGAKIIIIDDITLGGAALLRPKNATARIMQTLKLWAVTENLSILVLASVSSPHVSKGSSRIPRLPSPVSRLLSSFAVADSIFSINHSTFGPDYRYVKSIKNSALSSQPSTDVLAYRVSSPHVSKGTCLATENIEITESALVSSNSSLATHHSSLPPTPFLGLTFLGMSAEIDHLRDYAAEVRKRVEDAVRIQRHALDALPNDFLDVEVLKYLKS